MDEMEEEDSEKVQAKNREDRCYARFVDQEKCLAAEDCVWSETGEGCFNKATYDMLDVDGCTQRFGHDQEGCVAAEPRGCVWSDEKRVCYSDWCFQKAADDKEMCASL